MTEQQELTTAQLAYEAVAREVDTLIQTHLRPSEDGSTLPQSVAAFSTAIELFGAREPELATAAALELDEASLKISLHA